jgi:hypothetical protein
MIAKIDHKLTCPQARLFVSRDVKPLQKFALRLTNISRACFALETRQIVRSCRTLPKCRESRLPICRMANGCASIRYKPQTSFDGRCAVRKTHASFDGRCAVRKPHAAFERVSSSPSLPHHEHDVRSPLLPYGPSESRLKILRFQQKWQRAFPGTKKTTRRPIRPQKKSSNDRKQFGRDTTGVFRRRWRHVQEHDCADSGCRLRSNGGAIRQW